jgi:hypothetical protein
LFLSGQGKVISGILSAAVNVGYNVVAAGVIVMLVWFRDRFIDAGIRTWHTLEGALRRKKFVLIWVDDGESRGQRLCTLLSERDRDGNLYRALERPASLFLYSGSAKSIKAIILLDTDVTKLADEVSVQTRIEHRLKNYVSGGGTLIGSHDLIYRRVRCAELQKMYGCQTTLFYPCRPDKVHYQLVPTAATHPLRADLGDEFDLDDGEVVWGSWAPDAKVIFATAEDEPKPLVVTREHGDGKLIWLNSGDKGDWMCPSLAIPEEPLLKLLANSVRWAAQCIVP